MQINIDTALLSKRERESLIAFLQSIAGDAPGIAHADNPETGRVAPPAVSDLTKATAALGIKLPSLEIPPPPAADPAAVFGGAAAPVPPAGATPPPPPAMAPAAPAADASVPSPASAPPVPPPPAGSPPAGVEVDATGLPHDTRIHALNRAKNADGKWRAKRGLNDGALTAQVEKELRAVMALPAAMTVTGQVTLNGEPVGPTTTVPVSDSGVDRIAAESEQQPSAAIAFGTGSVAPPPPPPAESTDTAVPTDLPSLMLKLTAAMSQGRVTQALITEACEASGVPSLPLLATRPDLIPAVFEYIRSRVQL